MVRKIRTLQIREIMAACLPVSVFVFLLMVCTEALAVSDLSTKFKIYVPPNNKSNGNHAILVVTAFQNNTTVNILDDAVDGDSDDTYENIALDEGQSFILFIKEGAVNDDALGKWDGDNFIVDANHPISVMQATTSSYQHDWLPAENKTMRGKKFFFYSPPSEDSPNDINLYSYADSTDIAIYDISLAPLIGSGITSVTLQNSPFIKTRLNQGEDLLSLQNLGKNQLQAGHTYLVRASKPVTAQFGALHEEIRDGGGFVPSANGSAVGDLFYFCVPGEPDKKEIRILSFENNAEIRLFGWKERWNLIQVFTLNQLEHGDWVSNAEGFELFKVVSVTGENISVFESNWLETSNEPGTADISTFAASEIGYGAGKRFVCYMPPPGDQSNVKDQGTRYSHLFLFGNYPNTTVRVYDTDSQGNQINQTIYLQENEFYDFRINTNQYNSIYNGDGDPASGPDRPYLTVVSDHRIAVMISDWNDNWLTFGASVLLPLPKIKYSVNPTYIQGPGQVVFSGILTNFGEASLINCSATVTLPEGVEYIGSNWAKDGTPETTTTSSGETVLTWSPFDMAIGEDVPFSILVNIPDPAKSEPSGLGNIFMSEIAAGGYSDGEYYETSDHAIVFVVEKIPLLPPTMIAAECRDGSVLLNWSKSPSENIIGYYIYRSLNSSEGFAKSSPALISDTTFVDTQVLPQNLYYYYIVAVNHSLTESEPSIIVAIKPDCNASSPAKPVLLDAAPDSANKAINLRWTIENRDGLSGFWVYRSLYSGTGFARLQQLPSTDTTYTDTTVVYKQTYYYVVSAIDLNSAESEFSNELFAQVEQRALPVMLTATPDSAEKSIALTWRIAWREQVVAFSVYRRQSISEAFERIAFLPTSDTSFVDLTVQYNQIYYYAVRASYSFGAMSPFSNEISASIYALPTPILLNVLPDSVTHSMKLIWTIERSVEIAGFKVYRRLSPDVPFERISSISGADTVYTDLLIENETTYYYRVTAFNDHGHESLGSNIISGRLGQPVPEPEVTLLRVIPDSAAKSISLIWSATEIDRIQSFQVYRRETSEDAYEKIAEITAPDTSYLDENVNYNQHYFYVVSAKTKSGGSTGNSNEKSGYIFYLPIAELIKADPDSVALNIQLEWQIEPLDLISGFIIYRKPEGQSYRVLAEVPSHTRNFTDTEVEQGVRYYYQIRCFDDARNLSRLSNQESAILRVPPVQERIFAYPNPCAETDCQAIHFRFALRENAEVVIDIYDLAGDFIHQLKGESIAGEWNELVWDVSRIASDVYLFVFRAKNQTRSYEFKKINKIAIVK